MVWLDQRTAKQLPDMGVFWETVFSLIRQKQTIDYFRSQAEANCIRENQRDIWEKTHKFLLLSGYLTYRLTGGGLPLTQQLAWACTPISRPLSPV